MPIVIPTLSPPGPDDTPTYSVVIAGVDRGVNSEQDQWTVNQTWGRHGDTAYYLLHDEHVETAGPNYIIKPLDTIVLTDTTTGEDIFSGLVIDPQYQWFSPVHNGWYLTCRDFSYYSDLSPAVVGTFLYETADSVIRQLISQANCGITANNVMPGPTIPAVVVNFLNLTDAINHVSQLATGASGSDYSFYIDNDRDCHWFNADQATDSGVTFTDTYSGPASATLGYYDPTPSSLTYDWDASQLRTSCLVRGASYHSKYQDNFVSNGVTTSFPLTYQFDDTVNSGDVYIGFNIPNPIVKNASGVGNTSGLVARTVTVVHAVGTDNTTPGDWQVVQSNNGQWFLQPGTDPLPAAGTTIALVYGYTGPIIARADNLALQQQYGGPNRGVFQSVVSNSTLQSVDAALAQAQQEVMLFSPVLEKLGFTAGENFPGHVNAGNLIRFANRFIPDSRQGYQVGVNAQFLILASTITGLPGNRRSYALTCQRVSVN